MKKIIFLLALLLFFPQISFSNENPKEIQFIYINGSNNNDKKMKKWFFSGVEKLHPYMYEAFNESALIKSRLLNENKYKISQSYETFFWGDRSSEEIQNLNSDLKITKMFSPKIAQTVRTLLAHYLHDAIWVSHYRNMHPVIDDLHNQVMSNYKRNKEVILFGYSAGSFITYEYMYNKLPDINIYDYFSKTNIPEDFKEFIKNNKRNNTCIDALVESGLAVYSADLKLIPNINNDKSKIEYIKMDDYTCKYCIPKGALKGIVNFGSPLILFYSDISNPKFNFTYYNKLLYKYILENDMFWITVNYADDPLGYTVIENVSYKDLKDKIEMPISPNNGFIYTKSNIKSKRTFMGAHTSYWDTGKKFAKAVRSAYEDGYKLYNDNEL